jgi:hypothetical protein
MTTSIHPSMDFKSVSICKPRFKFRDLYPLSATTLSLNSTTSAVFEIPGSVVWNPSQSMLNFTTISPAVAGKFTCAHGRGSSPIYGMRWVTETGIVLMDVSNLDAYVKTVLPVSTDSKEWESVPTMAESTAGFARSDVINPSTSGVGCPILNTGAVDPKGYPNGGDAIQTYQASVAVNTALETNWSIDFAKIVHTFASIKQNLYLAGLNSTLTVTLNPTQNVFFTSTALTLADGANTAVVTPITNLKLRLAIQSNEAISNAIKQHVLTTGVQMNIPWVNSFQGTTDAGLTFSATNKLTRANGTNLLRFYSILHPNNGGSLFYNLNNKTALKYTACRNFVNQVPLSDYPLSHIEHYTLKKDLYKGSIVFNENVHNTHSVVVEDFSGMSGPDLAEGGEKNTCGLSLENGAVDYLQEFTKPATVFNYKSWAITQKVISISKDGVNVL